MSTPEPAATATNAYKTPKAPVADYIIFEAAAPTAAAGDLWKYHGTIKARNVEAAIQRYVEAEQVEGGQFAAVPARSWRPVTVTVEQTTRIRLT